MNNKNNNTKLWNILVLNKSKITQIEKYLTNRFLYLLSGFPRKVRLFLLNICQCNEDTWQRVAMKSKAFQPYTGVAYWTTSVKMESKVCVQRRVWQKDAPRRGIKLYVGG